MKLLSINAGSSSLKFKLYDMPEEKVLIDGYVQRIGIDGYIEMKIGSEEINYDIDVPNHNAAASFLIDALVRYNVIETLEEITAIGHRIVHGGGKYLPQIIERSDLGRLEKLTYLSPVHMKANIAGIKAFMKVLPDARQVVVYDTAFHHTMPEENFLYPVPLEWYEKYGIRKFGFHGISCNYITSEMEKILKKKVNLIICHIGAGASVTAIKNSKSYNNSMGFTPNAGVMMATRSGDIDYSIIPYLSHVSGLSLEEIDSILNHKSGLEGIAPGLSDNRDLMKAIKSKDKKAILANKMYINKIAGYIAQYYVALREVDAIILCGGVGENALKFRSDLLTALEPLGISIDEHKNEKIHKLKDEHHGIITNKYSKIPCYVMPTDEEVMIAREVYNQIESVI